MWLHYNGLLMVNFLQMNCNGLLKAQVAFICPISGRNLRQQSIFSGLIGSVPGQLSGHVDIFTGTRCSSSADCSTYYPEIVHLWILE
jgi:hypothetical protein